jgi:hypothetical protein
MQNETKKHDALDGGVPMAPQAENAPKKQTGPEDAADPTANNRGQYADRMTSGDSYVSEEIPQAERVEGGPTSRLVPQFPRAQEIGVNPGKKGGVDQ